MFKLLNISNIQNKLFLSDVKYSPTFISKLTDKEKLKVLQNTEDETSSLVLMLYIMIIIFVLLMLITISQGDKYNPYPDDRVFKGDLKKKTEPNFFEKIYYIIFGLMPRNKYSSNCKSLDCKKTNNSSINTDIDNNNNNKYEYLNSFINSNLNNKSNTKSISESNNNYSSYFDNSRKCLLNDNNKNSNNDKYSYLTINSFINKDK